MRNSKIGEWPSFVPQVRDYKGRAGRGFVTDPSSETPGYREQQFAVAVALRHFYAKVQGSMDVGIKPDSGCASLLRHLTSQGVKRLPQCLVRLGFLRFLR